MERLARFLPIVAWGASYNRSSFQADLLAGVVVLFITIPQVIAYAFLAGLPAEAGLYAAILALVCYAAFGSSRTLAVGPTAIVAMMTLESTSAFAAPGTAAFATYAMKLGLLTGGVLVFLRLINFGALTSFLSHAVITGFISAAAILIISNQLPALLGTPAPDDRSLPGVMQSLYAHLDAVSGAVMLVAGGALLLLIVCRSYLGALLQRAGLSAVAADNFVKSAPMYAVVLGVLLAGPLGWVSGIPVVGDIPSRLPTLNAVMLSIDEIETLLPPAILIAMVVFLESTSIGAAMASKRRQKIDPNQELIGLGVANIGASVAGGFPVAGSFARTVVNFSAGAVTPVASLITALLVVVTLLGFAPLFHDLPKAVLSAIIVVSAWQLIELHVISKIFAFNRTDAITFSCTFAAVLVAGVETGILAGIAISFVLLIRNSSRPHIAEVGRVTGTEHFRNVHRYEVASSPALLALRIDESLYFVNTRYIETYLLNRVAESPALRDVLLICTATNFIDTSGLELLEELSHSLADNGITLHLAEVKGPVMDKLADTDFLKEMQGKVFFTTDQAFRELASI